MYWDNISQVSGSDFTTSSTTLVDITGLSFASSSSSMYEIEAVLAFQSDSTAGAKFSMQYSTAGATGQWIAAVNTTTGAASIGGAALNAVSAAGAGGQTANTTMTCWMKAIIITGINTGNITIRCQKQTSGTLTVYIGSELKVRRLA